MCYLNVKTGAIFWGGIMKPYFILILAIICEVIGTIAIKESAAFTRFLPSIIVLICYSLSYYLFSYCIQYIAVGIAYAIWSGLGTVALILIGIYWWNEKLQLYQIAGIILILAGSLIINLFDQSVT